MIRIKEELKEKLLAAQSAEEAAALVKTAGQEIGPEETEHLWAEVQKIREQDGRELSPDELESVSGGADRNWVTEGCAASVEFNSWCGSNDYCLVWDVTYEYEPTGHLCPNCGKNMYFQDTVQLDKDGYEFEDQYRCKYCGYIKTKTITIPRIL